MSDGAASGPSGVRRRPTSRDWAVPAAASSVVSRPGDRGSTLRGGAGRSVEAGPAAPPPSPGSSEADRPRGDPGGPTLGVSGPAVSRGASATIWGLAADSSRGAGGATPRVTGVGACCAGACWPRARRTATSDPSASGRAPTGSDMRREPSATSGAEPSASLSPAGGCPASRSVGSGERPTTTVAGPVDVRLGRGDAVCPAGSDALGESRGSGASGPTSASPASRPGASASAGGRPPGPVGAAPGESDAGAVPGRSEPAGPIGRPAVAPRDTSDGGGPGWPTDVPVVGADARGPLVGPSAGMLVGAGGSATEGVTGRPARGS